jgi:hypothetical protein
MTKYPVSFDVVHPGRSNRKTVFFRLILSIPIVVLLVALASASGFIFIPTLLMIVYKQKYPKWWFDWNVSLTKFMLRVGAYLLLLRDDYPSTDDEQGVKVVIKYPNVKKDMNRWFPLLKWILIIPHLLVLAVLLPMMMVCTVFAWVSILVVGTYPLGMFGFSVGVLRWSLRANVYATLLTTDKYPPFSLAE